MMAINSNINKLTLQIDVCAFKYVCIYQIFIELSIIQLTLFVLCSFSKQVDKS